MIYTGWWPEIGIPRRVDWGYRVNRWRRLVRRFFRAEDVELALGIIYYESRGKRRAVNPESGCAGLFQHKPVYWSYRSRAAGYEGRSIFDAEANIATAAWLLYKGQGWGAWAATYPDALAAVFRGSV
jgi:soluble lytic murein transglycosylase-like protein